MLGSCRCNAPARSSCFRTKLTIGCTIHYTGNSTLPIMYTTLFLVYGLPFWVTESEPSICIVNCSYRGCRQHSLCKGLQSTNTGVFSDQVRKVTKHPGGGSLGLGGCFLLILSQWLVSERNWVCHMKVSQNLCKKLSQVHEALGRMCHTLSGLRSGQCLGSSCPWTQGTSGNVRSYAQQPSIPFHGIWQAIYLFTRLWECRETDL